MNNSKIEWTESTWNPVTGCDKFSDGCLNCYAEKMARRLFFMKNKRYVNNFKVTLHEDLLEKPLTKKKSQMIFVCSMADLFHKDVPNEFIDKIFKNMAKADWHIFQVLTKRTERMAKYLKGKKVPSNIWIGTTIESNKYTYRVDLLKTIDAKVKFISCEPLISDLNNLNTEGIQWIVVGGESGSNSRPIKEEWVLTLRDKCIKSKTPFFFKQWGGWNKKKSGKLLQGKIYDELPG